MDQTVIGGFTVIFNGVTPVIGGSEWSYTVKNDGSEKDLSNWVLELKKCEILSGSLACSLGRCELVEQECPDESQGDADCETFFGIKFDDLQGDQPEQTFTFLLPYPATTGRGCFYLKFGQNRVCGEITVPVCAEDPPCPNCPTDSMREGKVFTEQLQIPKSACPIQFDERDAEWYLCTQELELVEGQCDQPVDIVMCSETESEQILQCLIPLDYSQMNGRLQIVWQLKGTMSTICTEAAVPLTFFALSNVEVEELCFFCLGQRPDINPQTWCDWFEIRVISLDADGLLTYEVTFIGC